MAALAVDEYPRVLLPLECGERGVAVPGREENLDELVGELQAERVVDLAVHDDDAPVGRGRVRRKRLVVRLLEGCADRDAARVRVLDDDAGGQRELAHEQPARGQVVQVVERERLAVQLLRTRQQMRPRAALGVVRGTLVRVLAVREIDDLLERDDEGLGERLSLREPRCDCGFVRRGRRESLGGELSARLDDSAPWARSSSRTKP